MNVKFWLFFCVLLHELNSLNPGRVNGNPLQYSCLGIPKDRGAWLATDHGVAKGQTRLSN